MRIFSWLIAALLLASGASATAETLSYTTYYHNDHLGSPVAATDEQGALLWRAHFRPYGERQEDPKSAEFGSAGYTGHVQDADSGMVYAGARYYDPLIGRFMAVDPVGVQTSNPMSFNRYLYGNNNPQKYVDPDGRIIETAWDVASIGIGVSSAVANIAEGNYGQAALDVAGVVVDTAAAVVPGVPGGAGAGLKALRAASDKVSDAAKGAGAAKDFFAGTKYTDKVLGQMKQGDFHAFPESVKGFQEAGQLSKLTGGDGVVRDMLKIPGEYRGKEGAFEFIKEADGAINHRLFRPNPGP
ncbi:MAG: RHS repeat domain-containing protein [Gammaproteobacteria bacterium]